MEQLNVDQLLAGLTAYRENLKKHINLVQNAFESTQDRWSAVRQIYGGTKAQELELDWSRANARFTDYFNGTKELVKFLDQCIEDLVKSQR